MADRGAQQLRLFCGDGTVPDDPMLDDNEVDLAYLDPPWDKDNGGGGRGAQRHYATHPRERILDIVRGARWPDGRLVYVPAPDAHMRMWCTTLSLLDALWLMEQLGFRYSTHDVWVKHGRWGPVQARAVSILREILSGVAQVAQHVRTKRGRRLLTEQLEAPLREVLELLGGADDALDEQGDVGQYGGGQYRRSAHEILLYGTRGSFARGPLATTTTSLIGGRVIPAPRDPETGGREHSRKPEEVWGHVEATSPYERRVAMFERGTPRPGWRFWGDEVGKFEVGR